MKELNAAYLVPGAVAVILLAGGGFFAGQLVASAPASAQTTPESTVTVVKTGKTKFVRLPARTVTAPGATTTIIKKLTIIRNQPVTVPERIVHTTRVVKTTTFRTKVIVRANHKKKPAPKPPTPPAPKPPPSDASHGADRGTHSAGRAARPHRAASHRRHHRESRHHRHHRHSRGARAH